MNHTSEWVITIDLTSDQPIGEEAVDDAVDELGAAVSQSPDGRRVSTTITQPASAHGAALEAAERKVTALFPTAHVERIEAVTAERHDADLAEPVIPPLVGLAEAAEILGVSRQRASQLAAAPGFPQPVARLAATPLWRRAAVEVFGAVPRRTGRPAKVVDMMGALEAQVKTATAGMTPVRVSKAQSGRSTKASRAAAKMTSEQARKAERRASSR